MKCINCGSKQLVEDEEHNEYICKDCGIVLMLINKFAR